MKLISIKPLVFYFEEIDSTQNFLKKHYKSLPNLTFVFSDFQTKGKGRRGRTWFTNKGKNLLFSVLIKDSSLVNKFDSLSILSSLIVKELISSFGIKDIQIKRPNDVYINGKKICGILLEGINENSKLKGVVIGIGININQDEFIDELRIEPTSLRIELNKEVDIKEARKKAYSIFVKTIKNINAIDYLKEVNKINYLQDKLVSFEYNGEVIKGIAKNINEDNSLKIISSNQIYNIKTGEVNQLKIVDIK